MNVEVEAPTLLGGVPLRSPDADRINLSLLLWGDAGCGKTTLAMTAPGHKLVLMFDPDGDMSITGREDVKVLDLSGHTYAQVIDRFRSADPYGIEAFLKANPQFETVVWDSVTAYSYIALQEAVSKNKNSSIEQPGIHGFQYRNASVLRAATALMSICKRLNRNIIFITHEGVAKTDTDGNMVSVTMALSESTTNLVALRINEVWHMTDTGREHKLAVRPHRMRKPMKTRMWNAVTPEFTWRYDPINNTGDGIATWFNAWRKGGGVKLPLPK